MNPQERTSVEIPIFRQQIRVLPSDSDGFDHANNTRYVHWMQQVAVGHSTALGWSEEKYHRLGAIWVVRRHIIDYIHPVFPGETILAETWVSEMKNVSSVRKYRFVREPDGRLLAEAETRWGFIDFSTGRPKRVPEEIQRLFAPSVHASR